jgi:hypothetical protein
MAVDAIVIRELVLVDRSLFETAYIPLIETHLVPKAVSGSDKTVGNIRIGIIFTDMDNERFVRQPFPFLSD